MIYIWVGHIDWDLHLGRIHSLGFTFGWGEFIGIHIWVGCIQGD